MRKGDLEMIRRLYDDYVAGDIARILAVFDEDVVWETVARKSTFPALGPRRGTAQVAEFFRLVGQHLDVSHFTPEDVHTVGDLVFVLGEYGMTVRASGRSIGGTFVHVFTMRAGRIVGFHEFADTLQFVSSYATAWAA